MEDIKAYIESGILELYVLGDVTQEEKLHVETMAAKHAAIKAELEEIGRAVEQYADEHAVEPSDELRNRVLNSLVTNLADDRTFTPQRDNEIDNVVPIRRADRSGFYKYAFAACFVLLIVSVVALINAYRKLNDSNTLIASLQNQNQRFSNTVSLKDSEIGVLRDPTFKMLRMKGTPKSPASALTVAWSPVKKKVWIDMATADMPANDKEHQYQLWALVGNKPVSLGVFNADTASKDMVEMEPTALADAFAVTLEPKGGSSSPTMSEMMVLGKF
ncbi:MAG TPA: anti-sigma factor [Mucilaginibacter sp.]|nr:anti-sigma factor [Mucilaginibacter sp.]